MPDPVTTTAARLPSWLRDVLLTIAMLSFGAGLALLALMFMQLGWTVLGVIFAVVAVVYGVFEVLALVGYSLYLMDREAHRGLR